MPHAFFPVLDSRLRGIANARLFGRTGLVTFAITAKGYIDEILEASCTVPDGYLDLKGALLLPAFADGHLHPDKTLMGLATRVVNEIMSSMSAATVRARIEQEVAARPRAALFLSVEARAGHLLSACIRCGTLRARLHVDVDAHVGLEHLRAIQRAAAPYRKLMDLQIVAFPQSGVSSTMPGSKGVVALLRHAIAAGADVVGGLDPRAIDGEASCQLDTLMGLAIVAPHGADIHLHETGHQGADTLRDIVSRVSAEPQLRGKIVVSHASCLGKGGGLNSIEVGELDKLLADAGVAIMTDGALGLSAMRRLRAAGVTVFLGCDNVYDPWCGEKLTEPDILGVAATIAATAESNSEAASNELLDMMTIEVLRGTGLPGSAVIELGAKADFVVVKDVSDARVTLENIKSLPRRVFRGGRELIVEPDPDRSSN